MSRLNDPTTTSWYIRKVPRGLIQALKVQAATADQSLSSYVVARLWEVVRFERAFTLKGRQAKAFGRHNEASDDPGTLGP